MPKIPERWLEYKPLGLKVCGTKFIAFKTPLGKEFNSKLPSSSRFTPDILLQKCPTLKMVIDLTNTDRYYNRDDFISKGILYEKIMCPGQVIPPQPLIYRFFEIVDDFYLNYGPKEALIGIHCTHGVNRTGYFIGRYMVQRMGFHSDKAIQCIEDARGYKIERENFVKDLKLQKPIPSSLSSGKKTFNSKDNLSAKDIKSNGTVKGKRKGSLGHENTNSGTEDKRGSWGNKGRETPLKKTKGEQKPRKNIIKKQTVLQQGKSKTHSSKESEDDGRRFLNSRGRNSRSAQSRNDSVHHGAGSVDRSSGSIPPRGRPGGIPHGEPSIPTSQRGESSGAVRHHSDHQPRNFKVDQQLGDSSRQRNYPEESAGPSGWSGKHDFSKNQNQSQHLPHGEGDPRYWDKVPRGAAPFVPNNPPALSEFYEVASRGPRSRSRSPARHFSSARGRRSLGRRDPSPGTWDRYHGRSPNEQYSRREERRSPYQSTPPCRVSSAHRDRMSSPGYDMSYSTLRGRPNRPLTPPMRMGSPRIALNQMSSDRIPHQRSLSPPSYHGALEPRNAPSPARMPGYRRMGSPSKPLSTFDLSSSRMHPYVRVTPSRLSPARMDHRAPQSPHGESGRKSPSRGYRAGSPSRVPFSSRFHQGRLTPTRGSMDHDRGKSPTQDFAAKMSPSRISSQQDRLSPRVFPSSRRSPGKSFKPIRQAASHPNSVSSNRDKVFGKSSPPRGYHEGRMSPPRGFAGKMSPSRNPSQQDRLSPRRRSPGRSLRPIRPAGSLPNSFTANRDKQYCRLSPSRAGLMMHHESRISPPRIFTIRTSPSRISSPQGRLSPRAYLSSQRSPGHSFNPTRQTVFANRGKQMSPPRTNFSPSRPMQRRSLSPSRRPASPLRRGISSQRAGSPVRRALSPRRGMSPGIRRASPTRRGSSPWRRGLSPQRRGLSPGGRSILPPRRGISPPRRGASPPRRGASPPRRGASPARRGFSPPRRGCSPLRRGMSPPRRGVSPPRRGVSPPRRGVSPPRRGVSPPRRGFSPPPPRRGFSPPPRRGFSPPRRAMSPSRRAVSPPRRGASPLRRGISPPRRNFSPPRRGFSPPRRGNSPSERFFPPTRAMSPGRAFLHPQNLAHDMTCAFEGTSAPITSMGGENDMKDCRDLLNEKRKIGENVPHQVDLRLIIDDVPPGSAKARLGPQVKGRLSPLPRGRSRSPRKSKPKGFFQPGPSRQRSPHSRYY